MIDTGFDVAPPKITRIPLHTSSLASHVDYSRDRHVAVNDLMRNPKNSATLAYKRQISSPGIKKGKKEKALQFLHSTTCVYSTNLSVGVHPGGP